MHHLAHADMADSPVKALILSTSPGSFPTDSPAVISSSSASHRKGFSEADVSGQASASSNVSKASEISMDQPSEARKKDCVTNARGADRKRGKRPDLRTTKETDAREKKAEGKGVDRRKDEEDKKGCYGNVFCKCAAGTTADCAAVCCCPLALLHLGVLALVRLPTAVLWKMMVNVNEKLCKDRKASRKMEMKKEMEKEIPGPWSYPGSPVTARIGAPDARLDWEILRQNFQTEQMDFGGFVHKSE